MFKNIREDIAVVKSKDVAATSSLNIFLNSTGMRAVWRYRRHHWLWNHGFKGLARFLATLSRKKFGVEIHPAAQIGKRFMIDHGMGVVIGETTIIGDDCLLYQGVTLGGTGKETGKRHPTLGNNVTVGVGACVLGDIYLCDNVKVGGGAVVVKDVYEPCTLVGVPAHAAPASWGLEPCCYDPEVSGTIGQTKKKQPCSSAKKEQHRSSSKKEFLPDPLLAQISKLEQRTQKLEALLRTQGIDVDAVTDES